MPGANDPSPPSGYTRTELVWAGKRTQVDRVALPFQCVETVNAPQFASKSTPTNRLYRFLRRAPTALPR